MVGCLLKTRVSSRRSSEQVDKAWTIRDGSENDLKEILSVRKAVFGETEKDKLDPRFWKWEFSERSEGKAFIYIAEEEGRMIGHFADLPRRFSWNGQVVLGTLSLDLMVHSDFRRKGIFLEMGAYAAKRVKENKALFMTAFPIRPETIKGLVKIGWKAVAELPVMVYPILFQGIVDLYVHFPPLSLLVGGAARFLYWLLVAVWRTKASKKIVMEEMEDLDQQFDRFWQKSVTLYPVMGVRDRSFLRWRYLENPTRSYILYRAVEEGEMTGYIVVRKVELLRFNSAVIVDLLALNEKAAAVLIEKAIERCRSEGVDLLGCMIPRRHPYCRSLRNRGFVSSRRVFQFMVYPLSEEVPIDPESWYVNWGDTDVI